MLQFKPFTFKSTDMMIESRADILNICLSLEPLFEMGRGLCAKLFPSRFPCGFLAFTQSNKIKYSAAKIKTTANTNNIISIMTKWTNFQIDQLKAKVINSTKSDTVSVYRSGQEYGLAPMMSYLI
jgi:hypothetical protein